jgi:hypothetical protein
MTVGSVGNSPSVSTTTSPSSENSYSTSLSNSSSTTSIGDSDTAATSVLSADSPVSQGAALRALDGMTGNRSTSDAIARGELTTANVAATTSEVCTVEVRFKPIVDAPYVRDLATHAFIVTTDSDSVNFYRGGPQANNTGLNSPSGSGGSNTAPFDGRFGIYGPIVTEHGVYRPGSVDWTTQPNGTQVVDRISGNCNRIEAQFERHLADIQAARINYMPLHQNSNSTVRETLERAGYPDISPVSSAPAWNTQLPMPQ